MTRNDVLGKAVEECIKELYSYVQPKVEWDDFIQQNKDWKEGQPRPYEFYYLPQDFFKDIVEDYMYAYKIKSSLYDDFDVLINYFKDPIRDIYTKENGRSYENFTPLKDIIGEEAFNKIEEYVKEAKDFFNRNYEENSFSMSIYLGPSPNSNKQAVIDNWKKYRNTNIEIDESVYNEEVW